MEVSGNPRQVPFFVGRYRCEEYLGGGMADVYRASDTELPRDVAIKILKPANQHEEDVRATFIDEMQLASQCCHDNIVTIFDKGEFDGCPFIVMEFLRGDSLAQLIKNHTLGDLNNILHIARQLAGAMECVHRQKIVHRDLKPQNLNVDPSGRVKLVDFGIAKSIGWNKTQTGFTKGTAYYMAPEQVLGQPVSFATDVWAFGVVLFEMLTRGQRPFSGTTIDSLWAAIVNAAPDYRLLAQSGAPQAVQQIVQRCLEKQPERRYSGFQQISQELQQILDAIPAQEEVDRARVPRKAWLRWAAIASALICIAALISFALLRRTRPAALPNELTLNSGDMVLVPGGPALLGDQKHKVDVAAFYIDKTEVSNRAYADFLRQTAHRRPKDFREDKPDYPVVNVSYYDAKEFVKLAGKRLLSDNEWEKAARGSNGQLFPWGNAEDRTLANLEDNPALSEHALMPVTSFPAGASPFGALNMCGNVWEWVDSRHTPEPEHLKNMQNEGLPISAHDIFYSIRGGFYKYSLSPQLISDFSTFPAKLESPYIGFRCAKTPPK